MSTQSWLKAFPELADIDDPAWAAMLEKANVITVPKGTTLFRDGDACGGYVLVIEGSVRVQKTDPQGREIVLYRVEEGQTCMLTTTCLLAQQYYPAEGIAENETKLCLLPVAEFNHALASSEGFRRFVMATIGKRISDLMLLIEDVAFGRMDQRLARLLISRAGYEKSTTLAYTHQGLATELGTAREVVSRILKDFEKRNLVELRRGEVEVLDVTALDVLARDEK